MDFGFVLPPGRLRIFIPGGNPEDYKGQGDMLSILRERERLRIENSA
jgi:hypothetical protein